MLMSFRDSYHQRNYHDLEAAGPYVSRGVKRYDPHSRTYKTWSTPHDWDGVNSELGIYPRFTAKESRKMARRLGNGRSVDPAKMGQDWHHNGPKVGFTAFV